MTAEMVEKGTRRICENGLKVSLLKREDPTAETWMDHDEARSFLHEVMTLVQPAGPRYWLIAEVGNNPLFINPSGDYPLDAYESVLVADIEEVVLLQGNAFTLHHELYCGDCNGVISLTKPPLENVQELLEVYKRLFSPELGIDVESSLKFLVEQMRIDDLYVYCHEWEHFSFFAHPPVIQTIISCAAARQTSVETRIAFEER